MYSKFFGFKERPFEISPDPKFLYMGENHREALAHLVYAVQAGKSFTVITGEVGMGKTTLVQTLLSRIEGDVRTAHIFNPKLNPVDFLRYICTDLGVATGSAGSKGQMLGLLHKFLLECYARNEKVVLLIDEAQALDPVLLEEVRLLTNLETPKSKLLQVILLGQPELDKTLADPNFRQLKQRISVRYRISPLSRKETKAYIQHRLKAAGAKNRDIFDAGAIETVYDYSRGIPRLINVVCDNALLSGFATETKHINKRMIREVISSLERPAGIGSRRFKVAALMTLLFFVIGFLYFFLLEKF